VAEKSYKVLIADDEYWTRERLRTMINWKEYNLEFLEPAQDGEEVLKRMETERPDILITDINMPFLNGVDLVERVKEKYKHVVVFVISGYDDFDYVKRTLVAGAINYLLKPVSKIDLVNALTRALEIIAKEEEDRNHILKASSLIQDRELSTLLDREETPFVPTIAMNGNMDFAGYSLMLVKLHNMTELKRAYNYDMNFLSYTLKKKVKEVTGYDNLLIFNYIFRSNEFVVITELEEAEQHKIAVKITGVLEEMTKSPISITVSEHSYSIESIHSAYTQCVSLLMTRPYKKQNIIMFSNKKDEMLYKNLKDVLPDALENNLKSLLKSGNALGIRQLVLEKAGLLHCEEEGWEYIKVKQVVKKVCSIFMDYKIRQNTPKDIVDIENIVDSMDKTIDSMEADKLCAAMEELIDFVVTVPKEETSTSIREVVKESVLYIDERFFEELSLASLAERFGVESSYYSRIFRQETGKNLMLYIAEKRIEKAKEYMKDDSVNLAEVAFMVGYDDYNYFNRVFKKMTGQSPRDYRNANVGTR